MAGTDLPENPAPAAPASRKPARWAVRIGLALVVLVLLVAGLALTALRTDWGARNGWQLVTRVLGGALSGEYVSGSVAHGPAARLAPDWRRCGLLLGIVGQVRGRHQNATPSDRCGWNSLLRMP